MIRSHTRSTDRPIPSIVLEDEYSDGTMTFTYGVHSRLVSFGGDCRTATLTLEDIESLRDFCDDVLVQHDREV